MLPVRTIPRPTFAAVLADVSYDEVLHWISKQEQVLGTPAYKEFIATLPAEQDDLNLRKLLSAAYSQRGNTPDCFAICEDLKSVLNWPVNGELCELLAAAIKRTKSHALRSFTTAWVMATGTRFHGKDGDELLVYDPAADFNRKVKVMSIDKPTATAVVKFPDEAVAICFAEHVVNVA